MSSPCVTLIDMFQATAPLVLIGTPRGRGTDGGGAAVAVSVASEASDGCRSRSMLSVRLAPRDQTSVTKCKYMSMFMFQDIQARHDKTTHDKSWQGTRDRHTRTRGQNTKTKQDHEAGPAVPTWGTVRHTAHIVTVVEEPRAISINDINESSSSAASPPPWLRPRCSCRVRNAARRSQSQVRTERHSGAEHAHNEGFFRSGLIDCQD